MESTDYVQRISLNLVAVSTAEAGLHLRRTSTNLTNNILRRDFSDYAVKLFFS